MPRLALIARCLPGALALATPALATEIDSGLIPSPIVDFPAVADARGEVVLISDAGGWTDTEAGLAESLRADGVIVVGIDLPAWLRAAEDAPGGNCTYLVSDIEQTSHQVQRALGNPNYLLPTVAGIGAGGTLALAIAAQTPAATIGGTVAVDPGDRLELTRELCTAATRQETATGTIYDLSPGALPDPVTVVFTPAALATGRAHVGALAKEWPAIRVDEATGDAASALLAALAPPAAGPANGPVADLPLTVLDAKPAHDSMAVIFSGDGGWRDLDKTIGEDLQAAGVPVVGVDSLQYFWSEKTPEVIATDLARIIDGFRQKWGVGEVILVGYSFGADILPATYLALDPDRQQLVRQIALLGLSHTASFEISVGGWLGLETGSHPTLDDIRAIPPDKLQCFYGEKEADTACPALPAGADLVSTSGGHHFDGNYAALAQRILAHGDRAASN